MENTNYGTYKTDDKLLEVERMRYVYNNYDDRKQKNYKKAYDDLIEIHDKNKKKQLNIINNYLKNLRDNYFTNKKNIANETLTEYTDTGIILIK